MWMMLLGIRQGSIWKKCVFHVRQQYFCFSNWCQWVSRHQGRPDENIFEWMSYYIQLKLRKISITPKLELLKDCRDIKISVQMIRYCVKKQLVVWWEKKKKKPDCQQKRTFSIQKIQSPSPEFCWCAANSELTVKSQPALCGNLIQSHI